MTLVGVGSHTALLGAVQQTLAEQTGPQSGPFHGTGSCRKKSISEVCEDGRRGQRLQWDDDQNLPGNRRIFGGNVWRSLSGNWGEVISCEDLRPGSLWLDSGDQTSSTVNLFYGENVEASTAKGLAAGIYLSTAERDR